VTEEELLHKAINEPVQIVPYDSGWPQQFENEKTRLVTFFPAAFLSIEHVGSTAVPGLSAKPIIDIVAAVCSMEMADAILPLLCEAGYTASAEFNAMLKNRRWLMHHCNGRRTHHLHLVLLGSDDWINRVRFRDILRANPFVAQRYVNLKRKLAEKIGSDREAYTHAKSKFVEDTLKSTAILLDLKG
jgi:GrpB-like predicted nucleotidyltransferase (UPF0157 family)